jgi:flagellar biosynthesis regulator FlaF
MNAHKTYSKIQKETASGRDIEIQVLRKAAVQFRQVVAATDDASKNKLLEFAVRYNLRIWDVFQADWEHPACALNIRLRNDLLRLSLYVHKTSIEVLAYGAPEKVRALININECLAEGLVTGRQAPAPVLAPA